MTTCFIDTIYDAVIEYIKNIFGELLTASNFVR